LTSERPRGRVRISSAERRGRGWIVAVVAALLAVVFELDRRTGAAPFQHLYYAPIIVAGIALAPYAGAVVALVAIGLYHLANPYLLTLGYRESDIVQIALFLGIGIVTARLADDSRRFRVLAVTDDLTGLLNLRGFESRLLSAIRSARAANSPISILVLDVDRLKSVNDTHGHLAGADAVRTVGRTIADHLPERAFACRFGGDEFVIAMPGFDAPNAHAVASALQQSVQALAPSLAGIQFAPQSLSISIGLACLPAADPIARWPGEDAVAGEALFHAADKALYVAKTEGRNRVATATESLVES
jgi:diguanylate cyclase (GGDEF)-like protein